MTFKTTIIGILSIMTDQTDLYFYHWDADNKGTITIRCLDTAGSEHMITIMGYKYFVILGPTRDNLSYDATKISEKERMETIETELGGMPFLHGLGTKIMQYKLITPGYNGNDKHYVIKLYGSTKDVHTGKKIVLRNHPDMTIYYYFGRDVVGQAANELSVNFIGWNTISMPNTHSVRNIMMSFEEAKSIMSKSNRVDPPIFTLASFDIESHSSTGMFPDADVLGDVCFNIAINVERGKELKHVLFELKPYDGDSITIDRPSNTEVRSYTCEINMILDYFRYLHSEGIHFLFGYNINGFDIPFLFKRLLNAKQTLTRYIKEELLPILTNHIKERKRVRIDSIKALEFIPDEIKQSMKRLFERPASLVKVINILRTKYANDIDAGIKALVDNMILSKVTNVFYTGTSDQMMKVIEEAFGGSMTMHKRGVAAYVDYNRSDDDSNRTSTLVDYPYGLSISTDTMIVIDLLKVVKESESIYLEEKLTSLKLNEVAKRFLGDQKDDMPYHKLFSIWESGNKDDLKLVAEYCLQDAYLCLRLAHKFNTIGKNASIANIATTNFYDVFYRKITSKITSVIKRIGYLNDKLLFDSKDDWDFNDKDYNYPGAFVFASKVGFHNYASVLDFSSLYPSIMITKNISFESLLGFKVSSLEGFNAIYELAVSDIHLKDDYEFSLAPATKTTRKLENKWPILRDIKHRLYGVIESDGKALKLKVRSTKFETFQYIQQHPKLTDLFTFVDQYSKWFIPSGKTIDDYEYYQVETFLERFKGDGSKRKSNFDRFYRLTVYLISDTHDPNNTGIIAFMQKELLAMRNDIKRRMKLVNVQGATDAAIQAIDNYQSKHGSVDQYTHLKEAVINKDKDRLVEAVNGTSTPQPIRKAIRLLLDKLTEYASINAEQLGIKLIMNSTYGLLGFRNIEYFMIPLAASITAFGKEFIKESARLTDEFKRNYRRILPKSLLRRIKPYRNADQTVVYGDTDSIFVKLLHFDGRLSEKQRKLIFDMTNVLSKYINDTLKKETGKTNMNLAYEKILTGLVLITKKKYLAEYYGYDMSTPEKLMKNGTVIKKSNTAAIVKELYTDLASIICHELEILDVTNTNTILVPGTKAYAYDRFKSIKPVISIYKTVLDVMHRIFGPTTVDDIKKTIVWRRVNQIGKNSAHTLTVDKVYIAEQASIRRTVKVDTNEKLPFIYVYKRMILDHNGNCINCSANWMQANYDKLIEQGDDVIRSRFNKYLAFQSLIEGPIDRQLLSIVGIDLRMILESMYDTTDGLFTFDDVQAYVKRQFKESRVYKDSLKIAGKHVRSAMMKRVFFCDLSNDLNTGKLVLKFRYASDDKSFTPLERFFFPRAYTRNKNMPMANYNYNMFRWDDVAKMYVPYNDSDEDGL